MKKRIIIIAIFLLLILLPGIKHIYNKLMIPDKVLLIGYRVDDSTIDFSKQIKNKESINEFENIFNEVEFTEEDWNKEISYPNIITHIRHKKGIATHWYEIWFKDEEGIAVVSMSEETLVGRLTKLQVDTLKRIINK